VLLSLGFRPTWLEPADAWRLAAVASLAMAEAGEAVAGLRAGSIRLKWPNDLVIALGTPGAVRKLAGVLGETEGLGTPDPRVVVGLGINVDWAPGDFPAELASIMTSLREAGGEREIDTARLLERFLEGLEAPVEALRAGRFDGADWADRQLTTGRTVRLVTAAGDEVVHAVGVDTATGALVVEDPASASGERRVLVGEISHVRLADPITAAV
jgi:BirA family biotin operon repressor/biotin-[acetyl-CoA-carboxylase] ligase